MDASTAILQLNDPKHFNTFSNELGEDMLHAIGVHVSALPSVVSVVLQGAGPHFSVGGNPYQMGGNRLMLAGLALSLRELYDGFLRLRALPRPVVGALHGTLVGGGVAGC